MATEQANTFQLEQTPIISVKEARKIMGIASNSYSNEKVENVLKHLVFLAEIAGKEAYSRLTKELVPNSPVGACNTSTINEEYN